MEDAATLVSTRVVFLFSFLLWVLFIFVVDFEFPIVFRSEIRAPAPCGDSDDALAWQERSRREIWSMVQYGKPIVQRDQTATPLTAEASALSLMLRCSHNHRFSNRCCFFTGCASPPASRAAAHQTRTS